MFHKTGVIKVMVPKAGAASPATGARLYNLTTDAINLPVGAIGAYTPVVDSGNPQAVNVASPARNFRFVMRRDTSRDTSPLTPREFEESPWLDPNCLYGINFSYAATRRPANHLMLVGSTVAATAIPTTSETNFRIQVSVRGDRSDMLNSIYNTPTYFGDFLSPDFDTLVTQDQRRDIITNGLAQSFNTNSQGKVLAMVLSTGNPGATNGIALASVIALPVGSRVTVGYSPEGRPVQLILDHAIIRSLTALNTLINGLYIRYYNPAGTPNVPNTVAVAGSIAGPAVGGNHIAFLSLDDFKVYYDYKMNTKSRITVGLSNGMPNALVREVQTPDEGVGQFHQLNILHVTEDQNSAKRPLKYNSYHVKYSNFLLEDGTYDIFTIESCEHRVSTGSIPTYNMFTTTIPVLSFEDATSPYFNFGGTAVNPQKQYLATLLNAYNTAYALGNPAIVI